MSTFEPWPKIPRWNRNVVISEKIDGTNAAIIIEPNTQGHAPDHEHLLGVELDAAETPCNVFAQSRNRLIRPGVGKEAANDNYGFAAWVSENSGELVKLLGPGRHYGEWYGQGIARNYGLDHRRFALFNTKRWLPGGHALRSAWPRYQVHPTLPVDVVPVLHSWGRPDDEQLSTTLTGLREFGSVLVPEFMRPEGVVLYHTAAGQLFKILLEGDELPKGVTTRRERELEAVG